MAKNVIWVVAPCGLCNMMVSYSVDHAPQILNRGKRDPLCEGCIATLNRFRDRCLLPRIKVSPRAYEPNQPWRPLEGLSARD